MFAMRGNRNEHVICQQELICGSHEKSPRSTTRGLIP